MPMSQAEPTEPTVHCSRGCGHGPPDGSALVQIIAMAASSEQQSLSQVSFCKAGPWSGKTGQQELCAVGGVVIVPVPAQPSHDTEPACPGAGIPPAGMVLGTINHSVLGAMGMGSVWELASARSWHT